MDMAALALPGAATGGATPAASDNLFICGLPSTCSEESVKSVFSAYGMVVSVKVLPDKGKPDRAALVRMSDTAIAQWLVENLNNNIPVGLTTPITVRFAQKSASTTPTGATMSGTVRIWLEERGMGFIVPSTGGEDFFVHRSNLCDGHTLVQGATVTFDPAWDVQKSKPVAKKVCGAVPNPALAMPSPPAAGGKGALSAAAGAAAGAPTGAAAAGQKSGFVKIWFEEKGFGFLAPHDGSGDAFVHRTAIQDGNSLVQGTSVTYTAEWDAAKGRFIARACYTGSGVAANTAVPQCGTVKVWFEEKGYGFLAADDGSGDAFVHRTALVDCTVLAAGTQVQYEAQWDPMKGKFIATKAAPINGAPAAGTGTVVPAITAPAATQQASEAIVISGLPATAMEESIKAIFGPYGSVVEVKVLGDSAQGRSAWMMMGNVAQAAWICSNLNGNMPVGLESPIWVQFASPGVDYGKSAAAVAGDARVAPY